MQTTRTIRNCSEIFRVGCPKQWEELAPTDNPGVRFCGQCEQHVYFCETDSETIAHARLDHCIARELPDASELPRVVLGQPGIRSPITPEQDQAGQWNVRERAVDDAIRNARRSSRSCPRCDYPAPDWRVSCRVCGFEFGRVLSGGGTDAPPHA